MYLQRPFVCFSAGAMQQSLQDKNGPLTVPLQTWETKFTGHLPPIQVKDVARQRFSLTDVAFELLLPKVLLLSYRRLKGYIATLVVCKCILAYSYFVSFEVLSYLHVVQFLFVARIMYVLPCLSSWKKSSETIAFSNFLISVSISTLFLFQCVSMPSPDSEAILLRH